MKNKLNVISAMLLSAVIAISAQVALEYDIPSGEVFKSVSTTSNYSDVKAVYGYSVPQPYYGIGGEFIGGYMGVNGYSTASGNGSRYGGRFAAEGGDNNYGIYATSSGYAGFFVGNVHIIGTLTNPSDKELKTDIKDLDNNLNNILALKPTSYYYDTTNAKVKNLPSGRQLGLIADEMETVLPCLIHEVKVGNKPEENGAPKEGEPDAYKAINYVGLIPVLVGAIKEQQAEINNLKALINK